MIHIHCGRDVSLNYISKEREGRGGGGGMEQFGKQTNVNFMKETKTAE